MASRGRPLIRDHALKQTTLMMDPVQLDWLDEVLVSIIKTRRELHLMNRSSLIRGILAAMAECSVDFSSCGSEKEITELLKAKFQAKNRIAAKKSRAKKRP